MHVKKQPLFSFIGGSLRRKAASAIPPPPPFRSEKRLEVRFGHLSEWNGGLKGFHFNILFALPPSPTQCTSGIWRRESEGLIHQMVVLRLGGWVFILIFIITLKRSLSPSKQEIAEKKISLGYLPRRLGVACYSAVGGKYSPKNVWLPIENVRHVGCNYLFSWMLFLLRLMFRFSDIELCDEMLKQHKRVVANQS